MHWLVPNGTFDWVLSTCPPLSFSFLPINRVPAAIISCLAHCSRQLPILLSTPYPEGSIHTLCHIMAVLRLKPSVTFQNKKVQSPYSYSSKPCRCGSFSLWLPSCNSVLAHSVPAPRTSLSFLAQTTTLLLMDYMLNSSALPTQTLSSVHSDANLIREPFSLWLS